VTPAAVGQQVRGLEAMVGTPIFRRTTSGLVPTDAARESLPILRNGLASMREGLRALLPGAETERIRISVAPTFAIRWLVPRLPVFYERYPDVELAFDTTMRLLDIAAGEADLAVRFGPGVYRALQCDRLFAEWVLPVCAPELANGARPIRGLEDLRGLPLVHLEGETADTAWATWPTWAEHFGLVPSEFQDGSRFNQSATTLGAALSGHGLALAGLSYSLDDIRAGRLVAPLGARSAIPTRFGYDIAYPPAKTDLPTLRRFRRWILGIAEETRIEMEQFLTE